MESIPLEKLKYPIGRFKAPEQISPQMIEDYILQLETLPQQLRWAVQNMMEIQLETTYRPEGWTVRQVVHHLPDSHMNSFVRFKLALTENSPTIKPYDEAAWANLPDSKAPVEVSLDLMDALHTRWVILLRNMSPEDYAKVFVHPASGKKYRLDVALALYAWHGDHHLAQIMELAKRREWENVGIDVID